MDLIAQLRVFIQVADSGGFSSAAAQLDLPRPTVSLAVQQLEARLGARLLHRTTRRVSLTSDGQALRERAGALVSDADEVEQLFRTQGAELSGHLRVDLPSRIARRLVAPALPAFLARHPHISIELGSSDRAIDLVREGVDCALRVGAVTTTSLVARPLGQLTMVNCASPAYLTRRGVPTSPQDLAQHETVQYAAPGGGHASPWEWTEGGRTHARTLTGPVTVNNVESYIACGLAGLGLIQVPFFDVQEELAVGALVAVLAQYAAPGMAIQIVYPHRHQASKRLRAFNDWLAGLLAPLIAAHDA